VNHGANGVVFRAIPVGKDYPVALKLLSPLDRVSAEELDALRRSFKNELIKTRSVSHWGVVDVVDSGKVKINRHEVPFTVLEFAPLSLRDALLKEDAFGYFATLFYSAVLCETLDFINSRGQIHRDIKPENLLFSSFGLLKVADLGIAEVTVEFEKRMISEYGAYAEKIDTKHPRHYFSPEQLLRATGEKDVDLSNSDCFQLGKVIHEMLTGSNPVGQLDPAAKRYKQIPNTILELLRAMLSDEPKRRPDLSTCAMILFAEGEQWLYAAETSATRFKKYERQIFEEWFSNRDCYDPTIHVGDLRVENFIGRMYRSGLIRFSPNPRGWFNFVALTPKGRDVRDILTKHSAFHDLLNIFMKLNRSPVEFPPRFGTSDWLNYNPRRQLLAETTAVLQDKTGTWEAFIVCPPIKLGSHWWVEIYSGELPLTTEKQEFLNVEWLVPYKAPLWVKKGSTANRALQVAESQLVKSGLTRSKVKTALSKLRKRQPRLSDLLSTSIGMRVGLARRRDLELSRILESLRAQS